MTLLALQSLEVAYGGIRAVKGIDLEVNQGETVCLIGANGAGKTTTLRAITGLVHPAAGHVRYDGANITGMRVHEIARRGLALVPEGRGVFPQLTVDENLAMGAYARTDTAAVASDVERAFTLFPRLKERRSQVAGTLSGGEQQMLAIGRALLSHPKLLLLDEPSMGLSPIMTAEIGKVIRQINALDVSIILVEQNAMLALTLARYSYVLETGSLVLHGPADDLLRDEGVRKAYLGI